MNRCPSAHTSLSLSYGVFMSWGHQLVVHAQLEHAYLCTHSVGLLSGVSSGNSVPFKPYNVVALLLYLAFSLSLSFSLPVCLCLCHSQSGCWKRIHYYLFIIIFLYFFAPHRIVCAVNIWRLSPAKGQLQQQQQGHHHHQQHHHYDALHALHAPFYCQLLLLFEFRECHCTFCVGPSLRQCCQVGARQVGSHLEANTRELPSWPTSNNCNYL